MAVKQEDKTAYIQSKSDYDLQVKKEYINN